MSFLYKAFMKIMSVRIPKQKVAKTNCVVLNLHEYVSIFQI